MDASAGGRHEALCTNFPWGSGMAPGQTLPRAAGAEGWQAGSAARAGTRPEMLHTCVCRCVICSPSLSGVFCKALVPGVMLLCENLSFH